MEAELLAKRCALAAADKKAEDVLILDLRGISTFTDFFVLCSGASEPQLKAIASEVQDSLRQENVRPQAVDGFPASQWVVVDYGDVLVHIFASEKRAYYALEDLWNDAPRLAWEEPALRAE